MYSGFVKITQFAKSDQLFKYLHIIYVIHRGIKDLKRKHETAVSCEGD